MTTVQFLQAVRQVLRTPSHWMKDGEVSDNGARHCIIGAVEAIAQKHGHAQAPRIRALILATIDRLFPRRASWTIAGFNDHRSTKHRDVLRVLDDAVEHEQNRSLWAELRRHTRRIPSFADWLRHRNGEAAPQREQQNTRSK